MSDIVNRLRELADAVTRGRDAVASEFTMSVPARPERDADLVLSAAADEIERLRATLERQQLSYEREREIDQDEIERLIALRRDDARVLDAERAGRAAAVLAMRDRCAKVCDDEARLWEAAGNGPATEARILAHAKEVHATSEHMHDRNNALRLYVSDLTAVMLRMVAGIDHLAEIARQWEPDHSSGADRRGWVLAKDARDDAWRLLQEHAQRIGPNVELTGKAGLPDLSGRTQG